MRLILALIHSLLFLFFVLGLLTFSAARAGDKVPDKLVFESKLGNVTFDHAKHVERGTPTAVRAIQSCFPNLEIRFNFKKGMHKPAEAQKTLVHPAT